MKMIRLLLLGAILFSSACSREGKKDLVLFDFESEAELDRLYWKCHTLMTLSEKYPSHGRRSLYLELYPSAYPGLSPMLKRNDWKGFHALCFDVYNPGAQDIPLTVRIDDQKDYPDYADRYNQSFVLKPGSNHIRIPCETLITTGTKRKLDLKMIYRLLIFMAHPSQKVGMYLDHIRLDS